MGVGFCVGKVAAGYSYVDSEVGGVFLVMVCGVFEVLV